MEYLVLPRKGPRPLGLAAQNLLALRVVSRPRRLYQLLVATHHSTAQGQLSYIGEKHHFVTTKQLFLQFMSPPLLNHCVLSVRQVFADTLPSPLPPSLVPFQDRRPAFPSCCGCMRAHVQCSLRTSGGRARSPCPKPAYFSRQQPPPTPSSGEEESLIHNKIL